MMPREITPRVLRAALAAVHAPIDDTRTPAMPVRARSTPLPRALRPAPTLERLLVEAIADRRAVLVVGRTS